ncbi:anti-sigma factor [Streptomyces sp. NPDC051940]|uniref:anti-sigma factor n=1 Tax=Streptomyces sp. NPDC051940 TaxID=3155675 RepID=UPI00341D17B6
MNPLRGRAHALAAPYALSALSPREERKFERHLGRCPACTAEVRALRQDTVRLARAVALPAPDAMRARVLAAIRTTEQEAPARPVTAPRGPSVRPAPVPRPAWGVRLAAAGAACALAVAAVFGVLWTRAAQDLDDERAQAAAVRQVLAAPDAVALSSREDGGGLNAVVSEDLGRAVVTLTGLPEPGAGRTYQLWAMDQQPGPIRPAGLLDLADPSVASLGASVRTLAVTEEPAGGSKQPTSAPLVQLALGGA